jgi:pimeloyl-ACP methyl ester carboxylesterase
MGGAWAFRHVIPGLVDSGYRVVVIDPFDPADVGSIPAPSLTILADRWSAALDSLGIEQATLVAHSLSSSIAFRIAARHPTLAGAIVSLEGGMVDRVKTPGLRSAAAIVSVARIFGATGLVRRRVASSLRERSANAAWVTKEVVEAYSHRFTRDASSSIRVLRELGEAKEPELLEARARDIHVPVLLLLGATRQESRPRDDEVARMQATLPMFTVETIANAGHYLHEEQPAAVVGRIAQVANGIVPRVVGAARDW